MWRWSKGKLPLIERERKPSAEKKPLMPLARSAPPEDIARARQEIERLKKLGYLEPDRGDLDDPTIQWRDGKPDYTVANYYYMTGKTKNHAAGSLELVVENMVKTWEMESVHKPFEQWNTVNHDKFRVQVNGGRLFTGQDNVQMGSYNWLFSTCRKDLYDYEQETYESSQEGFWNAFPHGFAFEVLEVYTAPPRVSFRWRHWANFTGHYKGNKGTGEFIELFGFTIVLLEDMKVSNIEIFYEPNEFLEVMRGIKDVSELHSTCAARGNRVAEACPFVRGRTTADTTSHTASHTTHHTSHK